MQWVDNENVPYGLKGIARISTPHNCGASAQSFTLPERKVSRVVPGTSENRCPNNSRFPQCSKTSSAMRNPRTHVLSNFCRRWMATQTAVVTTGGTGPPPIDRYGTQCTRRVELFFAIQLFATLKFSQLSRTPPPF